MKLNHYPTMSVEEIADDSENKMEALIEQGEHIVITEDGETKAIMIPVKDYQEMIEELELMKRKVQ